MNILAINGSARSCGNNSNILKNYLKSFNEKNYTTELIELCDLDIKNCKSCYACKGKNSNCIIEDDMSPIYKKVLDSDLLIISSPIYMWQVSAKTKLFMERLYPFYHFDKPSELKGKKLILIFTQAAPDKNLYKFYFEHVKASMTFLGFEVIKIIAAPGLREPDDYEKYPDILDSLLSS